MSELTLVVIKFAYLALLWIFVLAAVSVVRADMFGAKVARPDAKRERKARAQRAPKPVKPRRGDPTHVFIREGSHQGPRADQQRPSRFRSHRERSRGRL